MVRQAVPTILVVEMVQAVQPVMVAAQVVVAAAEVARDMRLEVAQPDQEVRAVVVPIGTGHMVQAAVEAAVEAPIIPEAHKHQKVVLAVCMAVVVAVVVQAQVL